MGFRPLRDRGRFFVRQIGLLAERSRAFERRQGRNIVGAGKVRPAARRARDVRPLNGEAGRPGHESQSQEEYDHCCRIFEDRSPKDAGELRNRVKHRSSKIPRFGQAITGSDFRQDC